MEHNQDPLYFLRKDYTQAALDKATVGEDPILFFKLWMEQAIESKVNEPNAMCLSTVGIDGRPSGRIVLLRGVNSDGFRFFTNYNSRKGAELSEYPFASLTFFWPELERQVRIEGVVEKTSQKESDDYFYSRPIGNRLGAWASPQSQVIEDRSSLEHKMHLYELKFGNSPIHRPAFWGGYLLKPDYVEFWQGRASRLHDRLRFTAMADGWMLERLAP